MAKPTCGLIIGIVPRELRLWRDSVRPRALASRLGGDVAAIGMMAAGLDHVRRNALDIAVPAPG